MWRACGNVRVSGVRAAVSCVCEARGMAKPGFEIAAGSSELRTPLRSAGYYVVIYCGGNPLPRRGCGSARTLAALRSRAGRRLRSRHGRHDAPHRRLFIASLMAEPVRSQGDAAVARLLQHVRDASARGTLPAAQAAAIVGEASSALSLLRQAALTLACVCIVCVCIVCVHTRCSGGRRRRTQVEAADHIRAAH